MFDEENVIAEIEANLGKKRPFIGRNVSSFPIMPAPPWAKNNKLGEIFKRQAHLVKHGVVGWACLIQANSALFEAGPENAPLQAVYAKNGDLALRELGEVAHRCGQLKHTQPMHGEEARLAYILTDEHTTTFGLRVPTTICPDHDVRTSAMYCFRDQLPGRFLVQGWFPILFDQASGVALFVPQDYWPHDLLEVWTEPLRQAEAQQDDVLTAVRAKNEDEANEFLTIVDASQTGKQTNPPRKVIPPVRLTKAASEYLGPLCDRSPDKPRLPLRIAIEASASGRINTVLGFEEQPIDNSRDVTYKLRGIRLVMSRDAIPLLIGTSIDYHKAGSENQRHGLDIFNPNFDD